MPKLFTSLLLETHPATQNQEDTLSGLRPKHFDGRHHTIAAGELICPEFWVVTGWARQGFYALKQFLLCLASSELPSCMN